MAGILHGNTLGLTRLQYTDYCVYGGEWDTNLLLDRNFFFICEITGNFLSGEILCTKIIFSVSPSKKILDKKTFFTSIIECLMVHFFWNLVDLILRNKRYRCGWNTDWVGGAPCHKRGHRSGGYTI